MAVFPTLVGVFPARRVGPKLWLGLPHARGGVSGLEDAFGQCKASSPRSWGCFLPSNWRKHERRVFPTLVGVFPLSNTWLIKWRKSSPRSWGCFLPSRCRLWLGRRLPHARGGVSMAQQLRMQPASSSPRSWGCFLLITDQLPLNRVFPTLVGVFPPHRSRRRLKPCLPHARGGVSHSPRFQP